MAKGITAQEMDSATASGLVPHLGTTTNSGNAYSIATSAEVKPNTKFTLKINAASTGAPTLKVNERSAAPIKRAGDKDAKLLASVYTLFWDGTVFTLQGEGGEYGTAVASDVRSGKTIVTENGLVTGNLPVRATGPTTVNPTSSNQTLYSGIYDGSITIKAGGRKASGYIGSYNDNLIQVTGLEFQPSLVVIQFISIGRYRTVYLNSSSGPVGSKMGMVAGAYCDATGAEAIGRLADDDYSDRKGAVSGNSFRLRFYGDKTDLRWYAYE
ncbi:hypothetical protein [Paenibacillus faecalis]|uniref:hypothetical protein n=1 Tax=Paenibacillus faecalis TaxID=2079532 RepID=UPI000D112DD4|nr:hypothetical protein [Paenibacillus faecalis]